MYVLWKGQDFLNKHCAGILIYLRPIIWSANIRNLLFVKKMKLFIHNFVMHMYILFYAKSF